MGEFDDISRAMFASPLMAVFMEMAESNDFERYGLQWVGDWHTHPEGGPTPSDFDLAN